jgi:hypothetical protein
MGVHDDPEVKELDKRLCISEKLITPVRQCSHRGK